MLDLGRLAGLWEGRSWGWLSELGPRAWPWGRGVGLLCRLTGLVGWWPVLRASEQAG